MNIIQELKEKYIVKNNNVENNNYIKRNLQAEINKINSISQLLVTKNIHPTELARLSIAINNLNKILKEKTND